jgi:hypothetical protein
MPATPVGASGFTARLGGAVQAMEGSEGPLARTQSLGYCSADNHQVIFTRR